MSSSHDHMANYVAKASDVHGQLLLLMFLSAITGLGKGGVPGFATIATALVVATAPEDVPGGLGYSVSLMVPILSMIDIYAAWLHKEKLDWQTVRLLLPISFIGMALGQILDQYMSDRSARILVGSILMSILILRTGTSILSGLSRFLPDKFVKDRNKNMQLPLSSAKSIPSKQNSVIYAWVVGIIGGIATMLTNSMGPIVNVYLLSVRKLSPESYIGTRACFFCFVNVGKLPMRFAAGTLGWSMMPLATCLGMIAVVGVYFAKPIMLTFSEEMFVKLELWVVALAGLKLLFF